MLTNEEVQHAMNIRDQVADAISRVNRSTSRDEKVTIDHARKVTERLIELGYIDVVKVQQVLEEHSPRQVKRDNDNEFDDMLDSLGEDDIPPVF